MISEEVDMEDIVLLQLFKDQILNYGEDQADYSDLDSCLSNSEPCLSLFPRPSKPALSDSHHMSRLANTRAAGRAGLWWVIIDNNYLIP